MSIRDRIKNAPTTVYKTVDVKEWEGVGEVRVKSWTAGERIDFDAETAFLEEHVAEQDRDRLLWARAVARSIVEDDGSLAFAVPTMDCLREAAKTDGLTEALSVYTTLADMPANGLYRLFRRVAELNAMSVADEERIEKNSSGAADSSSPA